MTRQESRSGGGWKYWLRNPRLVLHPLFRRRTGSFLAGQWELGRLHEGDEQNIPDRTAIRSNTWHWR